MLLLTVEQVFSITGRGIVVLPCIEGPVIVRVGTSIRPVRPDKSTLDTKIQGIGFNPRDILLGAEVRKDDVPIGTQVWLIEAL